MRSGYAIFLFMAGKKQRKRDTRIFKFRPLYVVLAFLLAFFVMAGVYLSQQTKLSSIQEQKDELQKELDSLTVEEERLERMLEYMQTTEYLLQYAREKLGYVFPDDIRFYEDPSLAITPTPSPTPYVYQGGPAPEVIMPESVFATKAPETPTPVPVPQETPILIG